jgi:hypothetical protein
MASSRAAKVKAAIETIRRFYALGREIPPKLAHKQSYHQGVIRAEAQHRHINEDTLRKARMFTDPVEGYSRQELNELCRLIREVQSGQDEGKAIFGKTHVIRLLSVRPKRRRAALQKLAIKKGWSSAELEAEIARRFGTRRHGGRRRRIPPDRDDLLVQLEGMCEGWRRWQTELSREVEEGEEGHASLADLPDTVRRQVKEAGRVLWRLHQAVVGALKDSQPGRAVRQGFQEEQGEPEGTPGRKKTGARERRERK